MSTLDDLKKKLNVADRPTGWSKSEASPLRASLQEVVNGLVSLRNEMQKDHAKKLKVLETMMRHQAAEDPRYRVRKNVD